MNEKNSKLSRRNFLLSVGLGSAAGAAVMVAKQAQVPVAADASAKPDARGYQDSAHVQNYYRTTKV